MIHIQNATLIEFSPPRVREGMDVYIDGDKISSIVPTETAKPDRAKSAAAYKGVGNIAEIDASGKIVFPGFVCSHHHFYSGLARGILADIGPTPDFVSTLQQLWWRIDRALDEPSLRASALVCCIDAIRCGTTAVIDHHSSPSYIQGSLSTIAQAFAQTGLRGATCYETTDRNGDAGMASGIAENARFATAIDREKHEGSWNGIVEAHCGGHAPFTLADRTLEQLASVVEKSGRGLHIHIAEDLYDVSNSHAVHGKDLVPRLDEYGLLDSDTILAHGTHLSDAEVALVNERGSYLVHNGRSNMNNHVGYNHRIADFENLVIGTDGIGGDMFEETKFAYFKHRDEGGTLQPGDFVDALTGGDALLEGIFHDKFGRIEPGYKADVVIADYASPTPIYPGNLAGHMIFGMGSSIVETVIINGRIVMRDRTIQADTKSVYEDARHQAERLWRRVNTIG